MKKAGLVFGFLVFAVVFAGKVLAGKALAGEVVGIELRENGTVSVVEKEEVCRNPMDGENLASSGVSVSEGSLEELIEVLRETNRILLEIRDRLSEIEKDIKGAREETGLWGRMPVR